MKTIHGYTLLGELTSQNAGFCQWGFCEKSGHVFFIKELLDPKYPVDRELFSPAAFDRKVKICEEFFSDRCDFQRTLEQCRTGNNMIIMDFFREGTKYYIVTDKVESSSIPIQQVAKLDDKKKETLIRSILYSISVLHEKGIVHSDIKADNVLLKETRNGYLTAKIIDFDAGFLMSKPQVSVKGDFVYLAPEAYLKMNGERINLTSKIDIFALGILFHQYLTGELPKINSDDRYICLALLNKNEVTLSNDLTKFYRPIIASMLSVDPEKRPSARDILRKFEEQERIGASSSKTGTGSKRHRRTGFFVPTDLD